ncbi:MAG TPA: iron-sulfur cluster repair di-iron protein [Vicinamibacterales bacterium]|nr:iron-sulfur cluster repair di-iron protein [Vicinamibacterales bacterium]
MNQSIDEITVGKIVVADFRTAGVFEQFGIDFCCGGRQSVAEACEAAAVDPEVVVEALRALPPADAHDDGDVTRWPLDRLIDHIVTTHHTYVRSALPTIARHLSKLIRVHGGRHRELAWIAASFDELGRDLLQHMVKEERILFPYIRAIAARDVNHRPALPFESVENPIRVMEQEHREAGDAMRLIRGMTDGYTPPADGCMTYRVCFEEMAAFERDLHRHVHLEENVLFPAALARQGATR